MIKNLSIENIMQSICRFEDQIYLIHQLLSPLKRLELLDFIIQKQQKKNPTHYSYSIKIHDYFLNIVNEVGSQFLINKNYQKKIQFLIGLEDGLIKLNDLEKFEIIQQIQMDLWISVKSMRNYETKRLLNYFKLFNKQNNSSLRCQSNKFSEMPINDE
ncbi:unnamed protein product [Paramecium primaurelia]|uniref:Uncharacterized protein n=1 Tax=Paramecium primaurelia TaxID=5886 RepID=A0A8S1M8H5_PARPR|nr:unnamed protein product [Paramecium primaurelia]